MTFGEFLIESAKNALAVKILSNTEEMRSFAKKMSSLLNDRYADINGFKGPKTPREIIKDADEVKVVLDEDSDLLAFSMYRTDIGGKKRIGSAAIRSDLGTAAAQKIIMSDIAPYDNWYWVEASGAIEHLFKKLGGNPIPSFLASKFLEKDVELIEGDPVHYKRPIGINKEVFTKMIFGFKDKETAEAAIKSVDNYEDFKIKVNAGLLPLKEDDSVDIKNAESAIVFIHYLYEWHESGDCDELLPSWQKMLKSSKAHLEKALLKDLPSNKEAQYKSSHNLANKLLTSMPVLKARKFSLKAA